MKKAADRRTRALQSGARTRSRHSVAYRRAACVKDLLSAQRTRLLPRSRRSPACAIQRRRPGPTESCVGASHNCRGVSRELRAEREYERGLRQHQLAEVCLPPLSLPQHPFAGACARCAESRVIICTRAEASAGAEARDRVGCPGLLPARASRRFRLVQLTPAPGALYIVFFRSIDHNKITQSFLKFGKFLLPAHLLP